MNAEDQGYKRIPKCFLSTQQRTRIGHEGQSHQTTKLLQCLIPDKTFPTFIGSLNFQNKSNLMYLFTYWLLVSYYMSIGENSPARNHKPWSKNLLLPLHLPGHAIVWSWNLNKQFHHWFQHLRKMHATRRNN